MVDEEEGVGVGRMEGPRRRAQGRDLNAALLLNTLFEGFIAPLRANFK